MAGQSFDAQQEPELVPMPEGSAPIRKVGMWRLFYCSYLTVFILLFLFISVLTLFLPPPSHMPMILWMADTRRATM